MGWAFATSNLQERRLSSRACVFFLKSQGRAINTTLRGLQQPGETTRTTSEPKLTPAKQAVGGWESKNRIDDVTGATSRGSLAATPVPPRPSSAMSSAISRRTPTQEWDLPILRRDLFYNSRELEDTEVKGLLCFLFFRLTHAHSPSSPRCLYQWATLC